MTKLHDGPIQTDHFDGSLNGYQKASQTTSIYPGKGTPTGLTYVALKGCGEAGEFAEHVGKAMRDDNYGGLEQNISYRYTSLTPERRASLIKEIGDELWYIAAKCTELGITLEEAARMNIEKLRDRQSRGTLSGSGDNR